MHLRKVCSVAVLALTLLGMGGCADDSDDGVATDSAVTPQQSVSASASPTSTSGSEHNEADIQFAQSMIVHHQGALAMASLAEQQAKSTEVRALAEQIRTAQEAEVGTMEGWLEEWGEPVPGATSSMATAGPMDHDDMAASPAGSQSRSPASSSGSGMTGMDMSEMDLSDLEAAHGVEFDRMFLTMMIKHHGDAIVMARSEQAEGLYPEAIALAKEMESAQNAEIAEMQKLLAQL